MTLSDAAKVEQLEAMRREAPVLELDGVEYIVLEREVVDHVLDTYGEVECGGAAGLCSYGRDFD